MKARRGLRRAGVGVTDQALYSLTNFVLTILVARSVSVPEFGAYSLVVASYLIAIAMARGLTAEPFVVRYTATDPQRWRAGAQIAAGSACLFGLVFGAALVGTSLALDGALSHTVLVFGILIPGLVLQDFFRYAALAVGRPRVALGSDLTVAIVQFCLVTALFATGSVSVPALVGAWGIAGHVGASVGALWLGLCPRLSGSIAWLRHHKDLTVRYFFDGLIRQGGPQSTAYVVTGVAGLSDAAAIRGAQTVFGPSSIVYLGIVSAVTPEFIRVLKRSPGTMRRYVLILSIGLAIMGLLWGTVAVLIPNDIGEALLGDTWRLAEPLLIFLTIAQVAHGSRIGPMTGLRALGDGRGTLRARIVATLIGFIGMTLGASLDGARGVAIALAVVAPMQSGVWWRQFAKAYVDRNLRHKGSPSECRNS